MALKDDIADALAQEGDEAQADGIGSAIESYVGTLQVSASSIAGADSAGGTFSGAVNGGTLSIDGSVIASALKNAASTMSSMTAGGDAILAQAFNIGLMAAVPTWVLPIVGTTTPPPPAAPYPSLDTGVATCIFNPAPVVAKMVAAFAAMSSMTSGGDDKYATDLADAISQFYTSPITFTIAGATHLSGAMGTGQISES